MSKNVIAIICAIFIFLGISSAFMKRAQSLPLDNDEFYSQVSSVQGMTWQKIWAGHVDEGNNAPLFYSLQKVYQDVIGYQTPEAWKKGQWSYQHPPSMMVLRMLPLLCMAAGVALIFFYVTLRLGFIAGFYALLVSLSSFMVWSYACTARPYALWFFLSAMQMVLLFFWLEAKQKRQARLMLGLIITQTLLSLSVFLSIITNVATSIILWKHGARKIKDHLLLLVIPMLISIFYFWHAPKYAFFIKNGMMKLFGANLAIDRMALIVIAGILIMAARSKTLKRWFHPVSTQHQKLFVNVITFGALILAGSAAIYMKLKTGQSSNGEGFEVSNRYFMLITPIGIMMTCFASYLMVVLAKHKVLKQGILIFITALLIFRVLKLWVLLPR